MKVKVTLDFFLSTKTQCFRAESAPPEPGEVKRRLCEK